MSVLVPGEKNQDYLGDGLYVSYDGFNFWLRAERDGMTHEVALDPYVVQALLEYLQKLGVELT